MYDENNCTRCTAFEITSYLEAIADLLDIEGDGELEALTDGLLNLRWLFGFNGETLTSKAVDELHCTRCTSETIEPYLQNLTAP